MEQQVSQETIRSIIINDMVKKKESIVPIIGDDMIVYRDKDSLKEIPFQEFIVREFQKRYPYVNVNDSDVVAMKERGYYGLSLLSQYYNLQGRFLDDFMEFVNKNHSSIRLKNEVHNFLVTFNFPIIITPICFDIIENDLKDENDGYKSIWYRLNKDNCALPSKCIYHIFGQAKDGSKWVYDEDMLLTFLLSHNNKENGAVGLVDYIKENEKKLLVLGCNLPNWLFRFLWQPTQTGRSSNFQTTQGYWIHKDKPEDSFDNFLKKKNFSSDEQVQEILQGATTLLQKDREREASERESKIGEEKHFDVFISYASEDRIIATSIFEALKNMNVKVWFDGNGKGEITPGSPYWEKIKNGVKNSAHYMPIITENWMHKLTNTSSLKEETYLVRDWLAECRKSDNSVILKENYSIPVIVKGSFYNGVEITDTYVDQLSGFGVLPKSLFNEIDSLLFDNKDFSVFEKIEW